MKSVCLTFFLCLAALIRCDAQYVSLEDLITIHNSNYDKINNMLLPRGWVFQAKKTAIDSLGSCLPDEVIWAFRPNGYADRAHSYVVLAESEACGKRVTYQTLDIASYNKIRASIAKYKMTVAKSDAGQIDGKSYVSSTFVGAKYKLDLVVYTRENSESSVSNSYNVFLTYK